MERNAYNFESVGSRGKEHDLKIRPCPKDRRKTQPLHEQDYFGFSVVVQVLVNTRVSAFPQLSIGQLVGVVFKSFIFHLGQRTYNFFMYERATAESNIFNYQMRIQLSVAVLLVTIFLIYLRRHHFLKSTRVTFLSKEQGIAFLDRRSVRTLIDSYKYNECVARSAGMVSNVNTFKEDMVDLYKQAVLEFTPEEKKAVRTVVMNNNRLRNKNWAFVKIANYVDWGYPFTLEDLVVLPERIVSSMGGHTVKTLEHESIHIEQRKKQHEFNKFYIDRLGYCKPRKIEIPPSILEDTVTNPDGPDNNWVRKIGEEWFWFALVLQGKEQNPIGMAYKCLPRGSDHFTVIENGLPLTEMTHAFDGETNTYHPNEFVASLWSRG